MPTEEPTEWTSSLTVVHKASGDIRLCIDLRELNQGIHQVQHPMPTVELLFSSISAAKVFNKYDEQNAFWHVKLDEEPSILTTFSASFGRYHQT